MVSRRSFLRSSGRVIAGGAMVLALPDILRAAERTRKAYLERAVYAMGTTVTISAWGDDRTQVLSATTAAFDEVYRLERLLSVFRSDSDISRMNMHAGRGAVSIDPDTYEVLRLAKSFHQRSDGAFDITIEPLMRQWGFRDARTDMTSLNPTVGDGHLHLLGDNIVMIDHEDVNVDTGGIAVGFTVDRMVSVLRSHGIHTALVNHGGDIYAMGAPEDTDGWPIIVPHPQVGGPDLFTHSLKDRALATSTNTRNVRYNGGRTVGHIFDPVSGMNPDVCTSMTILAPTACAADAMSTACFVAGQTNILDEAEEDFIRLRQGERLDTSLR